jgi:hypothetical protein
MERVRSFRLSALVVPLALTLVATLISLGAFAASGVEMVRIRVEDGSDSVRIEMPVTVLEYVLQHSKTNLDLGHVNGREVAFPKEALLKTLKDKSAREKELLFFTVKESGKETKLYVRTEVRKAATSSKKPVRMVFSIKDKSGKESIHIGIGIDTINSWAKDYGKDEKKEGGDDFGPFVRACLADAKALGCGPLLLIEAQDGSVSFELE